MIVFLDTELTDLLPRDLSDPALVSIRLVEVTIPFLGKLDE